jgi:hypothetical protein
MIFCPVVLLCTFGRGAIAVLTVQEEDVDLVAVTWKEGKKNKDGEVTKKSFIATCGTTLDGKSHKKKRWDVHTDGKLTHRTVDVKRRVDEYFDGGQTIDVHNHASGRLVLADSAFASVKSFQMKKTAGLEFIGLVKTASKKFPKQDFEQQEHGRQGSLALESRRTTRWDWRFFQSFLGIILVYA